MEESIVKSNVMEMSPREIVEALDKYIVGQRKAKRAVAIALRNRVRRLKLDPEVREEITPKNILMIGPTGVGKTEIARRLAKLVGSPFIKIEATKYTEVGYVGRDVESMVRDLMTEGFQMVRMEMQESVREEAERRTEDVLLDLLLPGSGKKVGRQKSEEEEERAPKVRPVGGFFQGDQNGKGAVLGTAIEVSFPMKAGSKEAEKEEKEEEDIEIDPEEAAQAHSTREKFRLMLRQGKLEQRTVELTINQNPQNPTMEMFGNGIDDLEQSISGLAGLLGQNRKKKVFTVKRAREIIRVEEADKLIDRDQVIDIARQRVENTGIIFIDEIDKIAVGNERNRGGNVSREGVQRDILPIVEGATVSTRMGPVRTDHVLFIAAGAFNLSKPSDLIPELQGRFPLRVELDPLGKDDFLRILTEPQNSLTRQYEALLGTEQVKIEFRPDAIERLAALAAEVNSRLENIGARRLHTIMEALLEDLAFEATDLGPTTVSITADYVNEKLHALVTNQDLGRYIL